MGTVFCSSVNIVQSLSFKVFFWEGGLSQYWLVFPFIIPLKVPPPPNVPKSPQKGTPLWSPPKNQSKKQITTKVEKLSEHASLTHKNLKKCVHLSFYHTWASNPVDNQPLSYLYNWWITSTSNTKITLSTTNNSILFTWDEHHSGRFSVSFRKLPHQLT